MNVAIIFDKNIRSDTTGVYCENALKDLGHEVQYYTIQQATEGVIPKNFDLYLQVDDDLPYAWSQDYHPSAYWVIDTHRMPSNNFMRVHKARQFDHVFTAHKDGWELLECEGVLEAKWLPLACDPSKHHPVHKIEETLDWCFIGQQAQPKRKRYLPLLAKEFPNGYVGSAWGEDMCKLYSQSKIIFNASLSNSVNMRTFEAAACGGLLLTDDVGNGLRQNFPKLALYQDESDLVDTMRYYLENESERKKIAKSMYEEAIGKHTYQHRMKEIIKEVKK